MPTGFDRLQVHDRVPALGLAAAALREVVVERGGEADRKEAARDAARRLGRPVADMALVVSFAKSQKLLCTGSTPARIRLADAP